VSMDQPQGLVCILGSRENSRMARNWTLNNATMSSGLAHPAQPTVVRGPAVAEGITWRFETRSVCSTCQVIPQQARTGR